MAETSKKYDLTGVNGAAVFRDLPLGINLRMTDGALVKILANAHDGAVLIVEVLEAGTLLPTVGADETIFYADVKEVEE